MSLPGASYRLKVATLQLRLDGQVDEGLVVNGVRDRVARCGVDLVPIARSWYARLSEDREHFAVFNLSARFQVINATLVSTGTLSASLVHPREVFKPALLCSASAVVLVHNHPSGDPEPSPEDLDITRRLVAVGDLMGVRVADHLIITPNAGRWTSFSERGLL